MSERIVLAGVAGLHEAAGRELGVSDWLTVDQQMIDDFARTTRDEQWIHVDPARAAQGPFGTTIAHGFLTLSLVPALAGEVFEVTGFSARINYGLEKVRFPAPLPAGSRIRDRLTLSAVEPTARGARAVFEHRLESEGGQRPVCVATTVTLFDL